MTKAEIKAARERAVNIFNTDDPMLAIPEVVELLEEPSADIQALCNHTVSPGSSSVHSVLWLQ